MASTSVFVRRAMAGAIAGLFAEGETVIQGAESINTSYPGFSHHLAAVQRGASDPADYDLTSAS